MREIFRYRIPTPDHPQGLFSMDLPTDAKVISAGEHMSVPMMFVEAKPGVPPVPRQFALVESTGRNYGRIAEIPDGYFHLATWQSVGGVYVFHLYERRP